MPSSSLPATLLEDFSVCVSLEAGVTALEDSGELASELEDLTSVELDAGLELESPHPTIKDVHKQKARIKFLIYWNIPNYARKIC